MDNIVALGGIPAGREHCGFTAIARHHLPRLVFDYLDGGAEVEVTPRAGKLVLRAIAIRRANIECMLKLLGCSSIAVADRSYVDVLTRFRAI